MRTTSMTSGQVSQVLKVHQSTLSRWVRDGRIQPSQKLPGLRGAFLFDVSEVERVRRELLDEIREKERGLARRSHGKAAS